MKYRGSKSFEKRENERVETSCFFALIEEFDDHRFIMSQFFGAIIPPFLKQFGIIFSLSAAVSLHISKQMLVVRPG